MAMMDDDGGIVMHRLRRIRRMVVVYVGVTVIVIGTLMSGCE